MKAVPWLPWLPHMQSAAPVTTASDQILTDSSDSSVSRVHGESGGRTEREREMKRERERQREGEGEGK